MSYLTFTQDSSESVKECIEIDLGKITNTNLSKRPENLNPLAINLSKSVKYEMEKQF